MVCKSSQSDSNTTNSIYSRKKSFSAETFVRTLYIYHVRLSDVSLIRLYVVVIPMMNDELKEFSPSDNDI